MSLYSIYQSANTRDSMMFETGADEMFGFENIKKMIKRGQYSHVADIACGSLEDAFDLSNNINKAWIENDEVAKLSETVKFAGGCRSTSVGDIISHDGKLYVVAGFGFEELNK